MANYRAGDVIRLTRNAIGMTQEQLCEEICSVETLSRIENNKQGIGKDVYERLMAKMERNPLRSYAICSSMDMRIAEEKQALEDAVAKHDYKKAKLFLRELEQKIIDTKYNRQYIGRLAALVAFHTKEIDVYHLLDRLNELLRITVHDYEKWIEEKKIFPLTEQEIYILVSIANAYDMVDKKKEAVKIYEMLEKCLEQKYMDDNMSNKLKMIIMANCNKILGELGEYEKVYNRTKQIMKMACENSYGYLFSHILVSQAWNELKICEKEGKRIIEQGEIKRKLRQAFYIAAARNDTVYMQNISKYYFEVFQDNI